MLKTKIASLALAGLMTIGGTGITAFAAEPVESVDTTPVSIMTETSNMGEKLEALLESGHTIDGLQNAKANLDEKGITLEEAKENMAEKLAEFAEAHGLTVEEAQAQLEAFKESGKSVDGLKNIKANLDAKSITLEDAKANFEDMLTAFASERGIPFDEAKSEVSDMKDAGKTLEGLKSNKDSIE